MAKINEGAYNVKLRMSDFDVIPSWLVPLRNFYQGERVYFGFHLNVIDDDVQYVCYAQHFDWSQWACSITIDQMLELLDFSDEDLVYMKLKDISIPSSVTLRIDFN